MQRVHVFVLQFRVSVIGLFLTFLLMSLAWSRKKVFGPALSLKVGCYPPSLRTLSKFHESWNMEACLSETWRWSIQSSRNTVWWMEWLSNTLSERSICDIIIRHKRLCPTHQLMHIQSRRSSQCERKRCSSARSASRSAKQIIWDSPSWHLLLEHLQLDTKTCEKLSFVVEMHECIGRTSKSVLVIEFRLPMTARIETQATTLRVSKQKTCHQHWPNAYSWHKALSPNDPVTRVSSIGA